MTDKQIIINGLNLEYIKELLYNGKRSAISTNIFEAIIEELERKEREYERLTRDYFKQNEWLKEQKKELNQLKAENEELRNFHINLVGVKECDIGELLKLKQALAEIKEIAENEIDSKEFMVIQCMLNGNIDNKNKVLKQILQKISECEVKDEQL